MERARIREVSIGVAGLLLGWWVHDSRPVHAAPAVTASSFQFSSITPASALTMYNPDDGMLYVYQGAVTGNSHVNCSYRFHIPKIGGPIDRENCPIGAPFR